MFAVVAELTHPIRDGLFAYIIVKSQCSKTYHTKQQFSSTRTTLHLFFLLMFQNKSHNTSLIIHFFAYKFQLPIQETRMTKQHSKVHRIRELHERQTLTVCCLLWPDLWARRSAVRAHAHKLCDPATAWGRRDTE